MKTFVPFEEARKTTGAVLIEFFASWCPHCQRMMPIVAQVKELLGDQAPVYQYDIDKFKEDAEAAGVESIPTFIIYDNDREMWRHTGEITGEELLNAVYSTMEIG